MKKKGGGARCCSFAKSVMGLEARDGTRQNVLRAWTPGAARSKALRAAPSASASAQQCGAFDDTSPLAALAINEVVVLDAGYDSSWDAFLLFFSPTLTATLQRGPRLSPRAPAAGVVWSRLTGCRPGLGDALGCPQSRNLKLPRARRLSRSPASLTWTGELCPPTDPDWPPRCYTWAPVHSFVFYRAGWRRVSPGTRSPTGL
ncbi:hypothetical protein K491DRAFT_524333 [Lophiostoma macrostomum CBS 122681]|uniref:Uncharacterized protein n=1 Tax=Lophiostoma macrostomum CBS 122681 TaxID=1314788 RepID=A0A6A6SZV1_9PLEO|nr:hypothetical protein K491DRAFT_524333 [Lophiostoma macrostomum CBS 122681]